MTICGGFALGSTTLGGSTVQLCTACTPNLIITKAQGLETVGVDYSYIDLKELI